MIKALYFSNCWINKSSLFLNSYKICATFIKFMEENSVKSCLEQNSSKADALITQLSNYLKEYKQTLVLGFVDEKKILRTANNELKLEVNNFKEKLLILEKKNGLKLVDMHIIARQKTPSLIITTNPETPEDTKKYTVKEVIKDISPPSKSQEKNLTPTENKKDEVDINLIDLRIGRILNVKKHPDADSLYVEEIDVGESSPRTVVSGLVKHVSIEQMNQRLVVVMCNLKPAKMRGIVSQAMVMCASSPEKIELLNPPEGSVPGDRVSFQGFQLPDHFPSQLNPKKKIWEKIQPDLLTDAEGIATYKGVPLTVADYGVCTAPTMTNSSIK